MCFNFNFFFSYSLFFSKKVLLYGNRAPPSYHKTTFKFIFSFTPFSTLFWTLQRYHSFYLHIADLSEVSCFLGSMFFSWLLFLNQFWVSKQISTLPLCCLKHNNLLHFSFLFAIITDMSFWTTPCMLCFWELILFWCSQFHLNLSLPCLLLLLLLSTSISFFSSFCLLCHILIWDDE